MTLRLVAGRRSPLVPSLSSCPTSRGCALSSFIATTTRRRRRILHCRVVTIATTCTINNANNKMSSTSTTSSPPPSFQATTVEEFCRHLAAKQPTPGGGAAAAVSAALGAAAAHMAAVYTQQRPVENDAAAAAAQRLMQVSDIDALLQMANDDAAAYTALQATWKKNCPVLTADEKSQVQAGALAVPTNLVHGCHQRIRAIYDDFLPHCNPHIQSDAYVGIHLLAGAARAAYQTVLVNTPSAAHKANLARLLVDIQNVEAQVLVFVGK